MTTHSTTSPHRSGTRWTTGVGLLVLAVALLAAGLLAIAAAAQASPLMDKWVDPLPVPPVAQKTFNPAFSSWADYYVIDMRASQHKFNSSLGPATVWTYGQPGKSPVLLGPTIVAQSGRPVVVKYINNLPTNPSAFPLQNAIDPTIPGAPGLEVPTGAAIPHLHGGHTAARFDGTPMQWWTANGVKGEEYVTSTFTYMNDQPATLLWYHDHTMGATRFKPYLGLAAAYVLFDKVDTGTTINGQNVPAGYGKYHLPLVLQDKQFNDDGTLFYPTVGISPLHPVWVPEFFGDTPVVNGKAYPYLDTQPRRYRLRLLNGSQARFYDLSFDTGAGDLPFWVIGSEQGLLPKPVQQTQLLIAPGERFDVIVDFTDLPLGTQVFLHNDANEPYPDGDAPQVVDMMKFKIDTRVPANDRDTSVLPAKLKLPAVPRLVGTAGVPPRDIVAKENMVEGYGTDPETGLPEMVPGEVLLNGLHYMDPTTDFVKAGTTETWRWINLTVDAHPMHPHLVASQVVNRQAINVDGYTAAWEAYLGSGRNPAYKPHLEDFLVGDPIPPAPEEMGYKDTVKAYPGMVTRTRAKFTLPVTSLLDYNWKTRSYGSWVYHCHILEHEENDMMRPFVVVK
jgi:spore coat protein A